MRAGAGTELEDVFNGSPVIKGDFLPADDGFVVVVSLKQFLQFALIFKQLPQVGYSNRAHLVCEEALRYVPEIAGQTTVLLDFGPEFLNDLLPNIRVIGRNRRFRTTESLSCPQLGD